MTISVARPVLCAIVLWSFAILAGCRQAPVSAYRTITGETMGTYYQVKVNSNREDLKTGIDSLLTVFNQIFSTYDSTSLLSQFNESGQADHCFDRHQEPMRKVLEVSRDVHVRTGGYFDPTVMPLVRYWGFAADKTRRATVDSAAISAMLPYVGMDKVTWSEDGQGGLCLHRTNPAASLDFSAVAKGYGVDLVADYLEASGAVDLMVEIGGEVRTRGVNAEGKPWAIGIDRPVAMERLDERENYAIVGLSDRAIASSGNYRNFYLLDDHVIGHTIDPTTGYPRQTRLLAVSVIASECVYADALATGWMAMGYPEALAAADSMPDAEALFLYQDGQTGAIGHAQTRGMQQYIIQIKE